MSVDLKQSKGGMFLVLLVLAVGQKIDLAGDKVLLQDKAEPDMLLLNSDTVPGREISQILGLVQGHTVFAVWLGKDLSAIARLILGGELTEYTQMMGKARSLATGRMRTNAQEMGADAVINVRYMTTSVVDSAAELLVYGTAVKFKPPN